MNEMIGYPDPGLDLSDGFKPHTSHWGVFSARHSEAGLEVRPYAGDPDPNGIIGNFPGALHHQARIAQPAIRRGWLERGPGPDDRRGRDEFVSVSWEKALDLLAGELSRIRDTSGPGAVFGGSYGWSSAGRSNSYLRCKSVDQPLRCRTRRRLDSPDRLQRIQRILHAMDIQVDESSCLQVAADHEFRHQAPTDRCQ